MKWTELVYLLGVLFLFFLLINDARAEKSVLAGTGEIFPQTSPRSIDFSANNQQTPKFVFSSIPVTQAYWVSYFVVPNKIIEKVIPKTYAQEKTLKEVYMDYVDAMANKYKVNASRLHKTISCESGYNQNARGKAGEIGIAQFMPNTFRLFEKEFGEDLSIYNAYDQIKLMAWSFSTGKAKHWTCYKMN